MQSLSTRLLELLSSMRFAVSLLSVVAVASIAGTVVKQGEPYANYLNQFGPFWFRAFEAVGLYAVYNAPWFIAILAFLVASVSLCLYRNAPWMVREMRNFRSAKREQALRLLAHHAELPTRLPAERVAALAAGYLRAQGFASRTEADAERTIVSAKAGSANRLGYLLAHSAIVAICIGGLLDSNLPLQLRLWAGEKKPTAPNVLLSDTPASARLAPDNLSFRGNTFVPEGQASDVTVLNIGDGILIQELPFTLELKKFHIEHYSSGQPRLFASDVIVTDKESGESFETRIEVNKPLIYKGVAAYQASFDDGGTLLHLTGHPLLDPRAGPLEMQGRVGETLELKRADQLYRLELTGFRPFNVENVSSAEPEAPRERGLVERLRQQMGSGSEGVTRRDLRNVGPSFTYKLRDAAGQALEYHNYMLPVELEGRWVMLAGTRDDPNEPFRYLRVPIDEEGRFDSYWMVRGALMDERGHAAIAQRFARAALSGEAVSETMRERLAASTQATLETFARRGYAAVAEFLERAVPDAEREQAADVYLRVLQGAAWEAWQSARERRGQARLEPSMERARFVQDALNAVSDSFHYGVPLYFTLTGFEEVKASVFQMTRSPGQGLVYLGCALLVLGIFTMLYVRERRAWLIVRPGAPALLGMACNRRTMDFEREFERHRAELARRLGSDEDKGDGTG